MRAVGDWAPIVPFLMLTGVLLLGAAVWLIVRSFQAPGGAFTLAAWERILRPGLNRDAILGTLKVGASVATISTVVGLTLAWFTSHLARTGRSFAQAVLNVAANFTGASLAVAMISTFGGVGFVRLLLDDWFGVALPFELYSFWGIVLVYSYFSIPLLALLLLPAMGALRPEWWQAVQAAGGGRWRFWRSVGGPVLAPFALSGWVLIFAWSMGQFSVPFAMLGEASSADLMTLRLGTLLFSASGGDDRFQRAAALSVLLIAFSVAALVGYRLITRRMLRRLEGI